MFYVAIAIVGYFGWGNSSSDNILRAIQDSDGYWWLAQVIRKILAFKSFLTYPILVWPLFRELDSCLKLETAPPIVLGLPWAISSFGKWKTGARVCLVVVTYLFYKCGPRFSVLAPLAMIPFHLCQFFVIPLFSIVAIKLHRDRACRLPERPSGRAGTDDDREAIFGDRAGELPRAILIGLVSMIFGCLMVYIDSEHVLTNARGPIKGQQAAAEEAFIVPGLA